MALFAQYYVKQVSPKPILKTKNKSNSVQQGITGSFIPLRSIHSRKLAGGNTHVGVILYHPPTSVIPARTSAKEDIYQALEQAQDSIFVHNCIANPARVEGLKLDQEFAERLAGVRFGSVLLTNLEKFEGIDFVALAEKFVSDGQTADLIRNVEKFPGLDHAWLAHEAIYSKEEDARKQLVFNFDRLKGLSEKDTSFNGYDIVDCTYKVE